MKKPSSEGALTNTGVLNFLSFFTFLFIRVTFIGVTWVNKITCFKCKTLWYIICMLHFVFTTQSQTSLHRHGFELLYPLRPPPHIPFPLVTTVILLSVSMSFCFLFVYLLLTVLYPTHEWNDMVLEFFGLTAFAFYDILKVYSYGCK